MKVASLFHLERALAPIALIFALACGSGSNSEVSQSAAHESGQALQELGLLERMVDAPERTRYQGLRLVRLSHTVMGDSHELVYREDVACDGQGNFDIQCLDVLQGGLSEEARELFVRQQSEREGFVQRYRDFRIRDLERFQEFYRLKDLAEPATIAGRSTQKLHIERRQSPSSYYLVWVDPRTGLVLAWEQRTLDHAVLARVEFESLDYDPELSHRSLQDRRFPAAKLDLAHSLSKQVDFAILAPQLLPQGYRLHEASLLEDGEKHSWLTRVYSDGCEAMVLMHTAPAPSDAARRASFLDVLESANLVLMSGEIEGARVIAMGRMPFEDLRLSLQSAIITD